MFTDQSNRAKGLGVIGVAVMALVIGAWTLPLGAENEGANTDRAMTADINWPAGDIPDGIFCVAYALAYNYTGDLDFTWSGQFDNSYGSYGPLGEDQIVSGITSDSRASSLTLRVIDSDSPPDTATASTSWEWGSGGEDCEA